MSIRKPPIIDFGSWRKGSLSGRRTVTTQLDLALRKHGCFYLDNHGVERSELDTCFKLVCLRDRHTSTISTDYDRVENSSRILQRKICHAHPLNQLVATPPTRKSAAPEQKRRTSILTTLYMNQTQTDGPCKRFCRTVALFLKSSIR